MALTSGEACGASPARACVGRRCLRRCRFRARRGLALGVGAGVGLALAVAALELLARVDGGEVRQLLLARDLVGRALDDSGHGAL